MQPGADQPLHTRRATDRPGSERFRRASRRRLLCSTAPQRHAALLALLLLSSGNTQQSAQGRSMYGEHLHRPEQQAVPGQGVHSFVLNSAFHWQPSAPGSWEPLLYELEANQTDTPFALSALVVSSATHVMRLGERACAADEHDFRQFGEEMAAVAGVATPAPSSLGLMAMLYPERQTPPPALLVPHSVPRRHARRPISSFDSIIIWAWEGVYHQARELQRVLRPHYSVTLTLWGLGYNATDPALDASLYIMMTPHLAADFPPHYILWQTEQWGTAALRLNKPSWPRERGGAPSDFVGAFEGALEVWEYSAEHLRRYAPLFVGRDVRLRHVPFTWFPLEPPVREQEKDIDILFYGWVGSRTRRDTTLRLLQGPHYNLSIEVVSMEELTALLRRAKIVLNIHFFPAKVLEMCRIVEAISFGALVVSEPGADAALDAQWDGKVVFADGVPALAEQLQLYRSNSTLRLERAHAAAEYARATHATRLFLGDLLRDKRG